MTAWLVGMLLAWVGVAGASGGGARTTAAGFEIAINAPRGELKITCARGCDWNAGTAGAGRLISFTCEQARCTNVFSGAGPVAHGDPATAATPLARSAHARTVVDRVEDFEITVEWPAGTAVMTCVRGCAWELTLNKDATEFASGRPIPGTAGANKFRVGCDTQPRCRIVLNGKGKI